MAKRQINSAKKSKPFTTVILYLPMKISICGDTETKALWNTFFKKNKDLSKNDFLLENIRKDLKVKTNGNIFDDVDGATHADKIKLDGLALALGFPIQEYIRLTLYRAIEKQNKLRELKK